MLNTGLIFHLFSIFRDSGLPTSVTASVFVPVAATGALAQLGSGVLVDRTPIHYMLALTLVLLAAVLVLAPTISSTEMALGFGILMGVQTGIEMLISSVVWAQYFGRQHLGSIAGLASTILVGASALGPMPFGIARDLLGNYEMVLTWFAALPLGLAAVALRWGKRPGAHRD